MGGDVSKLVDVLLVGLAAGAVGRLVAVDSVLRPARDRVLQFVGGLFTGGSRKVAFGEKWWDGEPSRWQPVQNRFIDYRCEPDLRGGVDVSAKVAAHGVGPFSDDDDCDLFAASMWRAYIVDGLTCPFCVAWWAGVVLWFLAPVWVVHVFAVWQIAQLALKARG